MLGWPRHDDGNDPSVLLALFESVFVDVLVVFVVLQVRYFHHVLQYKDTRSELGPVVEVRHRWQER